MAKRNYKTATIYNARVINMKNLWEPNKEFNGRPVDKPAFIITIMVKKTRQNWFEEPGLAEFTHSAQALYNESIAPVPFQQIDWPIKDGDVSDPKFGQPEWRMGHWLLTATSTLPVEVYININGTPTPLKERSRVKNGDYVGINVSLAVRMNDQKGVKCYLNKVIFMAEGEEIVTGGGKSMSEMMSDAKAQGMNVSGFGTSGAPQQGFGQGFAPMANPVTPAAPAPFGSGENGSATFPSSGPTPGVAPPPVAPPQQQGYSSPGGFNAPQGFPPR